MFVYLKYNSFFTRFPAVNLDNCYKPTIGQVEETRVSPAIWFKILVLDSVLIDCSHRAVFWTTEQAGFHRKDVTDIDAEELVNFFRAKDQAFRDGELYYYDPNVDELFDTAQEIVKLYPQEPVAFDDSNLEAQQKVLKLLHCFILPAIKFSERDLRHLEVALAWIEQQLKLTEQKVKHKDKGKKNTEASLKKQRDRILESESFKSTRYISTCDEEFLQCILPHITKDAKALNEEYVALEKEKLLLTKSPNELQKKRVSAVREKRNAVLTALNDTIFTREEIKNVVVRQPKGARKSRKTEIHINQFHCCYVEMSKRCRDMTREIQDMILCKVKIASVREAIRLTIKEVKEEGESYGNHRKIGSSEMETDIFDASKKPEEWLTLEEKVTKRLELKPLGFHGKRKTFCDEIRDSCQRIQDEVKLFSHSGSRSPSSPVSPITAHVINTLGQQSQERRSVRPSRVLELPADRMSVANANIPPSLLETISGKIVKHILKIAEEIALDMHSEGSQIHQMTVNKLYICYESHVSAELLPPLSEVYELHYKRYCESLWVWLQSVSPDDMGFNDLHLTAMVVPSEGTQLPHSFPYSEDMPPGIDIPHRREHTDNTDVKEPFISDAGTRLNESFKHMSLDELYSFADQECSEMPVDIPNALTAVPPELSTDSLLNGTKETEVKTPITSVDVPSKELTAPEGDEEFDRVVDTPADTAQCEVTMRYRRPPTYTEAMSDAPPRYTHTFISPAQQSFFKAFHLFSGFLDEEDRACTLFKKLKHIQEAVSYVTEQISLLRQNSSNSEGVSTDDLISVTILLLSRLDANHLLKLYAHLNMMIHLCPAFMQGNVSDFALTTIAGAFQHLFEQSVLRKSTEQDFR